MEPTVKITSSENEVFTLNKKAAERSLLLKNVMKDYKDDDSIPVPSVDSESLKKIVEYLNHYENEEPKTIPKPLPAYNKRHPNKYDEFISEWDKGFLDTISYSMEFFVDVINAVFYMEIICLQELLGSKMIWMMVSKDTTEEIRELLNMGDDDQLGPEELKELEDLGL